MNQNRRAAEKLRIPIRLLVLDAAGAVLLGLGVAKVLAGVDLLPPALRFEDDGLTFIVGGLILMLPMVMHVIGHVREQQAGQTRQSRQ